jgi:hypothetical protein
MLSLDVLIARAHFYDAGNFCIGINHWPTGENLLIDDKSCTIFYWSRERHATHTKKEVRKKEKKKSGTPIKKAVGKRKWGGGFCFVVFFVTCTLVP